MKNIYIYNFINFSSPIEALLNFVFKLTTFISVFGIFYILFKNINSIYAFQVLLLILFILFLYINTNIINLRYYNQIFIKRKTLIFYVLIQIFFSYYFLSVTAILLSFTIAGKYPFYYFFQNLVLYFVIACIIAGLKDLKKQGIIIFLFLALAALSFFKNIFKIIFTNILLNGLLLTSLFPLFLSLINKLIYGEKKIQVILTFQNILAEKKFILKSCIFELLFLFRIKKKILFSCLFISIAIFSFILFDFFSDVQPYITRSPSVFKFTGFAFPLITGIFIVTYGQFIFTWSLFYLDELLLKRLSIKHLLLGKLFFLIFSVLIIYAVTFPIILKFDIMPVEYTAASVFNAFILSLAALTISAFNLSKINMQINPSKYKERGFIQSIINIALQRLFFIFYTILNRFFSAMDILLLTVSISILCLIFYPSILSSLEKQILKKKSGVQKC